MAVALGTGLGVEVDASVGIGAVLVVAGRVATVPGGRLPPRSWRSQGAATSTITPAIAITRTIDTGTAQPRRRNPRPVMRIGWLRLPATPNNRPRVLRGRLRSFPHSVHMSCSASSSAPQRAHFFNPSLSTTRPTPQDTRCPRLGHIPKWSNSYLMLPQIEVSAKLWLSPIQSERMSAYSRFRPCQPRRGKPCPQFQYDFAAAPCKRARSPSLPAPSQRPTCTNVQVKNCTNG